MVRNYVQMIIVSTGYKLTEKPNTFSSSESNTEILVVYTFL